MLVPILHTRVRMLPNVWQCAVCVQNRNTNWKLNLYSTFFFKYHKFAYNTIYFNVYVYWNKAIIKVMLGKNTWCFERIWYCWNTWTLFDMIVYAFGWNITHTKYVCTMNNNFGIVIVVPWHIYISTFSLTKTADYMNLCLKVQTVDSCFQRVCIRNRFDCSISDI